MRTLSNLFLALALAAPLAASSVLPVSFERLSRSAGRVVAGEVLSVESEYGADGYIYSNVTLRVRQASPRQLEGKRFRFRTLGGEVGGRRLTIQGMPRFEAGQNVALFLHDASDSALGPTVGLWQGVFFLERDAASGREIVVDSARRPVVRVGEDGTLLRGARTAEGAPGAAMGVEQGPAPMAADSFFEQVRAYRGER